jgi:hypothetical protein
VEAATAVAALANDVRPDGMDAAGGAGQPAVGDEGDPNLRVRIAAAAEDQTKTRTRCSMGLFTVNDGDAADEVRIEVGLRCAA